MSVKLWFIWVNGIWVSTFWMAMLFFHCLSLQLRKNFSVVVLLEIFSYTLPIRAKTWTYLQSNTIMYAHKHTSSRAMPPLPVVFPGTGLHWHRWWWREEAYKGSLEREWHGQFMSDLFPASPASYLYKSRLVPVLYMLPSIYLTLSSAASLPPSIVCEDSHHSLRVTHSAYRFISVPPKPLPTLYHDLSRIC